MLDLEGVLRRHIACIAFTGLCSGGNTSGSIIFHARLAYIVVSLVATTLSVVLLTVRSSRNHLRALGTHVIRLLCDDGEARLRILAEAVPQIVWTAIPVEVSAPRDGRWTGHPQVCAW